MVLKMSNKIEDKTLLHQLLPSSIADEEIFKNAATALHTNSDTKGHLNDGLFYYLLDSASSELLDHLASQWRVGVWRDSWPVSRKRIVLKTIIKTLSHYGTKQAIIDVLASLGNGVQMKEWWETTPLGTPHTFSINIDLNIQQVKAEAIDDAVTALDLVKPVRSQYSITQGLNLLDGIQLRPAVRVCTSYRCDAEPIKTDTLTNGISLHPGIRVLTSHHVEIPDYHHVKTNVESVAHLAVRTSTISRVIFKEE